MNNLWQDLRYGARILLKKPGFSLIAIITLALGIGANTAIFTIVNAVLLRPLPYPESERLMQIGRGYTDNYIVSDLSPRKFIFLRDNMQAFEAITASQGMGSEITLSDENQTEFIRGQMVTAEFFRVIGFAPATGRGFTTEEDSPVGERVVILSDGFWRRRFGADAGMIGRDLTLNNRTHTVVGIMPPGFEYFGQQDVFMPARLGQASQNEGHNWTVVGRLKQGVAPDQARSEFKQLFERFRSLYPDKVDGKGEYFGVMNWRANMTSEIRELLWILLGAVGFVLLIACGNVANLQFARAATRRREVAIRRALGAGRWRLIRQLLIEGIILSVGGGGAGLLLAVWGLDAMLAVVPEGMIPRADEISLDWRVLAFALAVSILTGVVSGLAPALQTLRVDVNRSLKEGETKSGLDLARGRLRSALVVVEVALALTLMVGAGLLLRTFANLRGVDTGFKATGVMTFEVLARGKNYDSATKVNDFYSRALERFRGVPGVQAVALTNKLPLDRWFNLPYRLAGQSNFAGAAEYRLISPDYFSVMNMSLQRGRQFSEGDGESAERVMIVNEAFARKNFAKIEPLGQEVSICCERGDLARWLVIGVVNETKQRNLSQPAPPTVFMPMRQATDDMKQIIQQANFVIRMKGDALVPGEAIRDEMRQLDPTIPIRNLRSMEQLVGRSVAPQRFNLTLLGMFAALGLILAAVGIYGVMAYAVSQRTHEIGLRMALGAQTHDVLQLVVRQGMVLAVAGVAIGLIVSYAMTRLMKTMLFKVNATDPLTFVVVALLLTFVTLLACWIPARRATKADPMVALRVE
ncbi:MAG: ABC transporter permease [Acidobacteria bacterium]|nr:ABC transporter permease [Acidobacteriota bacterium]